MDGGRRWGDPNQSTGLAFGSNVGCRCRRTKYRSDNLITVAGPPVLSLFKKEEKATVAHQLQANIIYSAAAQASRAKIDVVFQVTVHPPTRSVNDMTMLLSPSPYAAIYPRQYIAYRSDVTSTAEEPAITIDGNLDKPFWNDIPWTEDFVDISTDTPPSQRTM
eukprot:scaffold12193_cov122-Skeletonema_dohrnii-CCMP3373.AAC.6